MKEMVSGAIKNIVRVERLSPRIVEGIRTERVKLSAEEATQACIELQTVGSNLHTPEEFEAALARHAQASQEWREARSAPLYQPRKLNLLNGRIILPLPRKRIQ